MKSNYTGSTVLGLCKAILACGRYIAMLTLLVVGSGVSAQVITEFSAGITAGSKPHLITSGSDGNVWFTPHNGDYIGRITPNGTVAEFRLGLSANAGPMGITAGPDGNIWFIATTANRIGRITPSGVITEFSAGITPGAGLNGIVAGPDGNLWFTELNGNRIGKITTAGVVTEYSAGITPGGYPTFITVGPDGNLWFTEQGANKIGKITTSGVITEYTTGISGRTISITAGSDGNLWFTEPSVNKIGRITTSGVVTEFSAGITAGSKPLGIAAGPDGNVWFTENPGNRVGKITPSGVITEYSTGITAGATVGYITAGPDGNMWFTEYDGGRIGRITTSGATQSQSTFNVATDFSLTSNPNGIWTHGYKTSSTAAFTPFAIKVTPAYGITGFEMWTKSTTGDSTPHVMHNKTAAAIKNGSYTIGAGEIQLHPGASLEQAVVRWTAPNTGTFVVDAKFRGNDQSGTSTVADIQKNGVSLFKGNVTGYGALQTFSSAIAFAANDTLDFVVDAKGAYYNDSTGLAVTIAGSPSPSRFAYVANGDSNTISTYAINPITGGLTSSDSVASGSGPFDVRLHPSGKFLYSANWRSNNISIYSINQTTGIPTPIATTAAGSAPLAMAIHPTGKFAYVANEGSSNVSVYTIDLTTGTLTPGVTVAAGSHPRSIAIDPSGQFVYVVNYQSNNVSVYTVNQSTGALIASTTAAAGTWPHSVVVDPTGKFVYVANNTSNNVSVYAINQSTGALTPGVAVAAGSQPRAIAIDPAGKFAYAANYGSANVSVYTISPGTGALSFVSTALAGTNPWAIGIDPTGKFAYVANYGSANVSAYTINSDTGALTASSSAVTGVGPISIAMGLGTSGGSNPNETGTVSQVITFGSPPTLTVGRTATVTATGGASGNAVIFSSATPTVCTVSGSTVTGLTAGSCSITASQAGNATYSAATSVSQSITVGKASQSITFGTAPSLAVGGVGTVSATATSGLAITYSSATPTICSVSGNTVSGLAVGSCSVAANQAGNANYTAATQVVQSIAVTATVPGVPTMAYYCFDDSTNIGKDCSTNGNHGTVTGGVSAVTGAVGGGAKFGGTSNPGFIRVPNSTSLQFGATASFSFLIKIDDPSGMDGYLRLSDKGVFAIVAKEHDRSGLTLNAGFDANGYMYSGFGGFSGVTMVSGSDQLDGWASNAKGRWVHVVQVVDAVGSKTYFDGRLARSWSGSVDFGVMNIKDLYIGKFSNSLYPLNGTLDELKLFNRALSVAEIQALYAASNPTSTTLAVTPSGLGTGTVTSGGAPAHIACTGTAGVSSGTCESLETVNAVVTLTATAAAGSTFAGWSGDCSGLSSCTLAMNVAKGVKATFTANPLGTVSQVITFGSPPTLTVGPTATVTATGGASGNPVIFSSTTPAVCTVSGSTVTGLTAGNCNISASQAGNTTYSAAASVSQSITVGKASQSITFGTSPSLSVGGVGTVSATATSGLAVTFTSATPSICSVSGSTVSGQSVGSCSITANQAGNANYTAATQVLQSIAVIPTVPGAPTNVSATAGATSATISFSAPVNSGGASVTQYTVKSSPGGITVTASASPVTVNGLVNGVEYTFTVAATNSAGTGAMSPPSNTVKPTVVATPPGKPTNVRAVAGNESIAVTFDAPTVVGSSPIVKYQVACTPGGQGNILFATTITVVALTNNIEYQCRVTAINSTGPGLESEPGIATPVGQAKVQASESALDFGIQKLGSTSLQQIVELKNTGNNILRISPITTNGDFFSVDTCVAPLAGGGSCKILVTFTPTDVGVRDGELRIPTDVGTTPLIVRLSGRGDPPVPRLKTLTVTGADNLPRIFSPKFSPSDTTYGLAVSSDTTSVSVTASVEVATSTIRLNDAPLANGVRSALFALRPGVNKLTVRVTAADGVTPNSYTISVNRLAPTIAAGSNHVVALRTDGSLWAWGLNTHGQLGDTTHVDSTVPKAIGAGYMAVAAGDSHTLALQRDGSLWAWGSNLYGQLGAVTTIDQPTPKVIDSGYMAVAAGEFHSLALRANGELFAWGRNDYGQLADGTIADRSIPKSVGEGFTAVAAGVGHTLALANNGDLEAWGLNNNGQLGDGTTDDSYHRKVIGSGYKAIAAAGYHSIALKSDGGLWTWGANYSNQLGDGTSRQRSVPTRVGEDYYVAIAAGLTHNLALKSDGSLWAWGFNGSGELGDGSTYNSPIPIKIGSGFTTLTAGSGHSVAVKTDGTVWTAGANRFGQLGDGTLAQRQTLTLVANETFNDPFDLVPEVANNIPADKIPPFWVKVSKAAELRAAIAVDAASLNKTNHIYVVGYLDAAAFALVTGRAPVGQPVVKAGETGGYFPVVCDRNGIKQHIPGARTPPCDANNNEVTVPGTAGWDITKSNGNWCVDSTFNLDRGFKSTSVVIANGLAPDVPSCKDLINVSPADTTAPSTPLNITATAAGPGQVKLSWNAATDAVGVVSYNIYRGTSTTPIAILDNVTSYTDNSPQASTAYTYSVMACDAAANCSAASTPVPTTTPAQPSVSLSPGWNLVGNGGSTAMNVPSLFGDASKVLSIWKWVKSGNTPNIRYPAWAFYSPLQADGGVAYAASNGFEAFTSIASGEGFWVNAKTAFSVPMTAPSWILSNVFAPSQSKALTPGWSLIATGEAQTASAFNKAIGSSPPSTGVIPINLTSLWSWQNSTQRWFFYAPSLEQNSGLSAYLNEMNFLDLNSVSFAPTTGFWVNRP